MANQYESFRSDIVASILDICVKVSKDGIKSYSWQFDTVCSDVAKLTNTNTRLPDELKTLVRFEFNKLKDSIMTGDGWTDQSTRFSYVMKQGEIEYHRRTVASFNNLTLDDKITGAMLLLDKAGKSLANAKSGEQASNVRKRIRSIEKELDFLRKEKANQEQLKADAAKLLVQSEVVPV